MPGAAVPAGPGAAGRPVLRQRLWRCLRARLAREARLWQRQQGSLWCVLLAGWLALLWGVVWLAERAGMH